MNMKLAVLGVIGFLFLILLIIVNPFAIVDTGSRGVVLEWRSFNGKILEPGINFPIIPIVEDVVEINVQTQALRKTGMATYTMDGQTVTVQGVLNYSVDPKSVGLLYQELGLGFVDKVVSPAMEESTKSVVAKYAALDIPKNRGKISDEIEALLREKLSRSYIVVTDYIFENEDFDDSYENAIREKQVQEQNALKEKNVTAQEEEKKKQQILQAEAMAEKTKLEAAALNAPGAEKSIQKIWAEAFLVAAKAWDGKTFPSNMVLGGSIMDGVLQKLNLAN